jgi:TonB family protein
MVVFEGKQVIADGRRFALHKVDEYSPLFISVRELEVSTHYLDVNASAMNHEFRLRARLESPYWVKDVFIVLELDTDSAGKVLFLYEVGDLEPRQSKLLSLVVPLSSGLGEGKYQVHLFSEGMEVLQSMIEPGHREAVLDRMTKKRIASVKDAEPKLYVGPQPEYPKALMKAKTSGQVVVSLRVGANGRVYDPVVKSATDPAFGEAALAAVRLWRFLPQVKNGRPVEAKVNVPLNFAPPEAAAKKS